MRYRRWSAVRNRRRIAGRTSDRKRPAPHDCPRWDSPARTSEIATTAGPRPRGELWHWLAFVDLVLDVVRRRLALQPELGHRSLHLVLHRREERRVLRARDTAPATARAPAPSTAASDGGDGSAAHLRTSLPCGGAGRIGSVSGDCAFFCTSTSLTSSGGDEADTGTPPLSAPQMPLNTSTLSPVATILLNADERRADEVDAAHELRRPRLVRVDPVDDVRQHVERVGRTAVRVREAAFDVVEEQAERLALLPRLVPQHVHQLVARHAPARLDDEIRLARHRARSPAPPGRGRSTAGSRGSARGRAETS